MKLVTNPILCTNYYVTLLPVPQVIICNAQISGVNEGLKLLITLKLHIAIILIYCNANMMYQIFVSNTS